MEKPVTIWERVGHWIKPGSRRDGEILPDLAGQEPPERTQGDSKNLKAQKPGVFTRWARRDQILQQLQEDHARVLELMGAIHSYMATQQQRGQDITDRLGQVANSLTEVPAAARQQLEMLSEMAARLSEVSEQSKLAADAIPEMAGKHTQLLSSIEHQLALAGDTNVKMADSLGSAGAAVDTLGAASQAQLETLDKLQEATARQSEPLANLMARQNRRLTWLLGMMLVLLIGMMGLVGVVVWYQFGPL